MTELISQEVWDKLNLNKQKIILAFSGGSDSMALLDYLYNNLETPKESIIIAHLNHQIRTESEDESKQIKQIAKIYDLKCHTLSKNIPKLAEGRNLEATARVHRYDFLSNILEKHKADLIVTAHHQDDQIETVLINYIRGAGLFGLSGMPLKRSKSKIARPLLNTTKDQILKYLQVNKLSYITDSSNLDTKYLRNKLRLQTIPQIKTLYPNYQTAIIDFQNYIAQLQTKIIKQLLINTPDIQVCSQTKELRINRKQFLYLTEIQKQTLLYLVMKHFQLPYNRRNIQQLTQQITKNSSGSLYQSNNIQIWIDPEFISLLEESTQKQKIEPKTINLKNKTIIDWYQTKIQIDKIDKPTKTITEPVEQITIRQIQHGDKINNKKLKDILIKAKIPRRHRHKLPIITIKDKIIGIPGLVTCPTVQNQTHCYFNLSLVDSESIEYT